MNKVGIGWTNLGHSFAKLADLDNEQKFVLHYFLRFYLFIFREGKGEKKRGKKNIGVWLPLKHPLLETWPAAQACALTGN